MPPMWLATLAASAAREGVNVDIQTIIGNGLTFLTLVAAVVALWFASQSARAARDTVRPMEVMAANLRETADTLEDMAGTLITTAGTMQANLILAERGRRESRLIERLAQCQRVYAAVDAMERALHRVGTPQERDVAMEDGQAALRAALTPLPDEELPLCRAASDARRSQGVPLGGVTNPRLEIERVLRATRRELDDLLKSAAPQA